MGRNFAQISHAFHRNLIGYGASSKPYGTEQYSFRCMASDQLSLMSSLGFEQFHIAGHDGGGQVAHRLALDAPLRAISLTMMDIVPTHYLLDRLQQNVEESYYQWVFWLNPHHFLSV